MIQRRAVTLLELLVVFAILAVLVGMLVPAVQKVRERSRETVCKNNLHQLNLGVANYVETHKRLPLPTPAGRIGGWSYEVLPFIEQKNLHDGVKAGAPIASAPAAFLRQPAILRCPHQEARDETATGMRRSNYVLVPVSRRDSFLLYDAPISLEVPWASGPELAQSDVSGGTGPHRGGFFVAQGFQQGVAFVPKSTE